MRVVEAASEIGLIASWALSWLGQLFYTQDTDRLRLNHYDASFLQL
jgi:hypothetical protein